MYKGWGSKPHAPGHLAPFTPRRATGKTILVTPGFPTGDKVCGLPLAPNNRAHPPFRDHFLSQGVHNPYQALIRLEAMYQVHVPQATEVFRGKRILIRNSNTSASTAIMIYSTSFEVNSNFVFRLPKKHKM